MKVIMFNVIAIGIGGALGSLFRYFLNMSVLTTGYPLGTLIENVSGSFLLGGLTGWVVYHKIREWLKLGIGVGFCGGFTTMSTLAADSFYLVGGSSPLAAIVYIVLSLFGGMVTALIGYGLGERWSKARLTREAVED